MRIVPSQLALAEPALAAVDSVLGSDFAHGGIGQISGAATGAGGED